MSSYLDNNSSNNAIGDDNRPLTSSGSGNDAIFEATENNNNIRYELKYNYYLS
ncbi:MAG: hypothetical protein H0X03_08370 [Nitrosopumilus sp.]|nr:hypothetical protein [Nitrosopumilus sp.]